MKKKLAFVDYWHHEHTRSGDFLRSIFSEYFLIDDYWWSRNRDIPIEKLKEYDHIFFFHTLFPYRSLVKLRGKKIMWTPMYDGLNFNSKIFEWIFWKQIELMNIKILCFSNQIKNKAEKYDLENLSLKYFSKPILNENRFTQIPFNILFWYRGHVKLKDWINLFQSSDVKKIIYLDIPDPNYKSENIDENFLMNYKIKVIKIPFSKSKLNFIKHLEESDIFIAPRFKEGLGHSFVEAISMGKYIVAYNDATMNEYIINEKIGFLFDVNNKSKINIKNIINYKNYRIDYAKKNYNEWKNKEKSIVDFFCSENLKIKNNKLLEIIFYLDDLKIFLKKVLQRK